MNRLLLSVLVLGLLAGVASADRGRGRYKRNWNGPRHQAIWSSGGVVVSSQRPVYQPRRIFVDRTRYVRRPIYVQRPVVQYRYYNYYQRPALIAERSPAMEGYYWVAGQWTWTGYEWTWTPGHYEPDPGYTGSYMHYHDDNCGHVADSYYGGY